MRKRDLASLISRALRAQALRSGLTILSIAIGIASVVLLTSIGEGIHRYVLDEFTQFGTRLIAINPGRALTAGMSLGIFGTDRPLSIEDAEALGRLRGVRAVVPFVQGNAEVDAGRRRRRTSVYGTGPEMPEAFTMRVRSGRFLPGDDPERPRAFAVLGSRLKQELFGPRNPLGRRITIADERYRVVGVMQSKGQVLGFDLDDAVYIPAARALGLFNRNSLLEIDVLYRAETTVGEVTSAISRTLIERHGKEDFTITTQQQMLDVLGNILAALTFIVGAIGGISLFVGAIGIGTIMTIAVSERTHEIGLLKALGANDRQVLGLFLGEAAILAACGGLAGLAIGLGAADLLALGLPRLPVHTPLSYLAMAETMAIVIGLLAGVLPARRAAGLSPIEALHAE